MKLFIKRKKSNIDATLEYDALNQMYTLLKGSRVSNAVSMNSKFRSANSVEKARSNGVVNNCILIEDIVFKSSSTAANFVTGTSTNGKIAWRNENGRTLREIQAEEN